MPPRDESMDAILGRTLRRLRESGGMTQAALGDRLGVTFQQVQKYERGVNRISASTLIKAAQALEVPPAALLDGQNEPSERLIDDSADTAPGAEQLLAAYSKISSPVQRQALVRLACDMASASASRSKQAG